MATNKDSHRTCIIQIRIDACQSYLESNDVFKTIETIEEIAEVTSLDKKFILKVDVKVS